jgi:hypothetical protein
VIRGIVIFLALLLYAIALSPTASRAQEEKVFLEGTVRLVLTDGTTVVGTIESQDDVEMVFRTTSDVVMTIPKEQVKRVVELGGEKFYRTDPNRTRLFFAPTGRAVGKGAGYLSFYEILFPFVAVGMGPAVTMSGGVSINPGEGRIFYIAPKVTVLERGTRSLAIGAIGAGLVGDEDGGTAGLVFAVGSVGPSHSSGSIGLGIGYADGEFAKNPALMVGYEYQASNNIKLLSENYAVVGVEDGLIFMNGVRFFGDKLAADIALITSPAFFSEGGFPFFPWIGFAYNFGQ